MTPVSSGQKPRTPEFFPRMNDRAGRRRVRRERKKLVNHVLATLPSTMAAVGDMAFSAINYVVDTVTALISGFLKALGEHNARHQLTATPSQGGANGDSDHP